MKTVLIIIGILIVLRFAYSLFKYRKKWNDPVEKQMRIFNDAMKKKKSTKFFKYRFRSILPAFGRLRGFTKQNT